MTADAIGGVWQYATDLAAALPRHGFDVLLAIAGPRPGAQQLKLVEGLPGVTLLPAELPLDWLSDAAAVRNGGELLVEIARRERVDLVHLNSPALAAMQHFAVPVVIVAHGDVATWWEAARPGPLPAEFGWHAEATAQALRAADLALAPSASFAETLRRRHALSAAPQVVLNGRDLVVPPMAGDPEGAVLTAGRLWDTVKNAAVLDAVAARIAVPFVAAGALVGPHGERFEAGHLQALGQVAEAELSQRLRRRPVFVSAATFEPFGLAVLEAAAAGCALVLSDIPTFRELWDGAATFVAPSDAKGFAGEIERLLADPRERARLGQAARRRAASYSGERMAAHMAGHYDTLLARRAAA